MAGQVYQDVDAVRSYRLRHRCVGHAPNVAPVLDPAFQPRTATSIKAFISHLGRGNVAFADGHMELIPLKTLLRMQGADADIYFDCGK